MLMITGASRSGTTMMSRVFGQHSKVHGLNETHYFGDLWTPAQGPLTQVTMNRHAAILFARLARGVFRARAPDARDRVLAAQVVARLAGAASVDGFTLFRMVTDAAAASAGKLLACEQTPRNIYYARALLELDPNLHVVHLIRDPRAVLASQKGRWRRRKLGGHAIPLRELVRTWSNYHVWTMSTLWVKATQMAWSLRTHARFHLVRFEDIVARPEVTIRRLCKLVELEFEPAMLDVPVVGSSLAPDREQRGIVAGDREAWRQTLTACEVSAVERRCEALMSHFDYEPTRPTCTTSGRVLLGLQYPVHLAAVAASNPRRAWIQARGLLRR